MKKINIILAAATLFTGVAAQAQSTAKTLYTGTSFPVEQGWSELRLDASVNPIAAPVALDTAGGALKLSSVNAPDQYSQLGWYKLNQGLDLSKGYTIELKAKLKVAEKGSFNIQGYDNSGKGFRVTIANTFLSNLSDPLKATQPIADGLTADDAFHVYRLAVKPSAEVDVYRDGEKIGSFALSTFRFDNIVENGGFEDEEFPDFLTNSVIQRIDDSSKVYAGKYALEANNEDKLRAEEAFRTRPFAVKPGAGYEISITRRRTNIEPYGWRDLAAYHDGQEGAIAGTDLAPNITSGSINDPQWQIHNNSFTADSSWKSVRFEFPTWVRDGSKTTQISSLDNIVFRERLGFGFNKSVPGGLGGTIFPEGYVNLIANGGFEDHTVNNDGSAYEWALSNEDTQNTPTSYNDLWNGEVRIQKNDKTDDELGGQWAHSGTSSLRFSTLGDGGKNFDFTQELEPGKTYRFNFWHRSPKWPDQGWLKVSLGDSAIWGHELIAKNNVWANADLVFTATETHNVLHLYSADHGNWFNVYLDDLVLYEVTGEIDPQIAGKTNLIANGDFEDATVDNSGAPYTWALASGDRKGSSDNYPVAWSDLWGSYVRLQDVQKGTDTGLEWAHSGSKSLRFSYLNDMGHARTFEGIPAEEPQTTLPKAYRANINFEKELEANKTYTFVFWLKAANYNDKGVLNVANGDVVLWREEVSTKYVSWTRHSITFSTTQASRTLRIFTEFTAWCNFYLDDLFLYEEDTYVPYEKDDSYIFFGKSQSTASADVEVEYVKLLTEGAHEPGEEAIVAVAYHYALSETADTTAYADYDVTNAAQALPIPEREYYSFLGWYDNADFTGDPVVSIPQGATGRKEYWGKWQLTAQDFAITYNENGGTSIPDSSYTYTSATVVLSTATEREHYTFAGWYANEDLTGEAVTEIPTGSLGNKAFWAKWAPVSYTITYHPNGAVGIPDTSVSYTVEDAVTLPTAATGYTIEWYDNEALAGSAATEVPAGSSGNKDFWARSIAIRYTIQYQVNNGTAIPDSSYTIESQVALSTATSREGYTFAGWYTNYNLTGEAVAEIPAGSTGNKVFYAKWEADAASAVSTLYASGLRIYPNPVANGLLTISNLSGGGQVEIYSLSGTLAASYNIAGDPTVIDISALPAGTYIVKANGKTAKIVKE
jgi:uncharacterized repeat protein (TIGR02543 family)